METIKTLCIALALLFLPFSFPTFGQEGKGNLLTSETMSHSEHPEDFAEDDLESMPDFFVILGCARATAAQIRQVNTGNQRRSQFQRYCEQMTGSAKWCSQVERPNPDSRATFKCTYGSSQVHRLIHPDESTWRYAVKAIQLVQDLQGKGFCVSRIYNWWRPEPYNRNVGGAAGRHPYGTSVDVSFCNASTARRAFDELCNYRRRGEVRALGYYGNTGVHIGVGDRTGNTWGRSCG
jgi:hypothetical protein